MDFRKSFICSTSYNTFSIGGVNVNVMDLESCMASPFDLRPDTIYSMGSLSSVFESMASDAKFRTSSCVLISALLMAPENSLFSLEIETENAAIFSSADEEPLPR